MLAILSPAKSQDCSAPLLGVNATQPQAKADAKILVAELKKLRLTQIKSLMSVSDKIATLNLQRFKIFDPDEYNVQNAKQAGFAFQGDAYRSMDMASFSAEDLDYAQQHLMILSGLYGYLRPLDLIQAYRLEMKTKLQNPRGANLYNYWGNKISKGLNKALKKAATDTIINLASSEYFSAIDQDTIEGNIITAHFKELKNDQYKVIGINAKRARGAMTRYMMQKRINDVAALKKFKDLDYKYNAKLSDENNIVFIR